MSRKFQFYQLDIWVQEFIKQYKFYLYKVFTGLPFRLGESKNNLLYIQSILFFIGKQGYWYG